MSDDRTSISDVAIERILLAADTTCESVDGLFQADPRQTSVVVASGDGACLVSRPAFYQAMSGRLGYGRTLHYRRPVVGVVPPCSALDGDTPLELAALAALESQLDPAGDVLVRLGCDWGTVHVSDLHRHAAELCRQRLAAVEASEHRFRALVEKAADAIVVLDETMRVRYRSRAARNDDPLANVHPDDVAELRVAHRRLVQAPHLVLSGEFRAVDATRAVRIYEYTARNLLEDAAVAGIVVNYREITERKILEDKLRHHALHDALTGLANRQLLFDRLRYGLERLGRVPGAITVLYCDLDGFKQINDSLGHALGDAAIVEAGRRLTATVRRGDTVARFGGDEFVVLADDADPHAAEELAHRIVSAFTDSLIVDGERVQVTVSVGHATTTEVGEASAILRQADMAMYSAKLRGRNRACPFDATASTREVRARRLAGDLRLAIARGDLTLAFQPIYDVQRGGAVGAEALLRWNHPLFGAVSPAEAVPVAEAEGLIGRIGRWAVDEACGALRAWSDEPAAPSWVSVNLSPIQLDEDGLVHHVVAALYRNGLRPEQLHLELTETALTVGRPERLAVLGELRDEGIVIAVDDFGTGYSSLSSVAHLPIDEVKIDRIFVSDLDRRADAAVMLRGIVDLAHSLGHRVVAEGVERHEELYLLESMGCDLVQGFLLGRPLSADALVDHVRAAARHVAV